MSQQSIVDIVSQFVINFIQNNLPKWAVYHTLDHTIETVETSVEIGLYYKLSKEQMEILSIAGWFHDTGYIYGPQNHEEKSVEIATNFLNQNDYPTESLSKVINCIMATKITSSPENLLEFIIRDADLVSLGRSDYFKTNNLLKQEFEMRDHTTIKEIDWLIRSEKFLSSHSYFTNYAKLNFYPQLQLNLEKIQKRLHQDF